MSELGLGTAQFGMDYGVSNVLGRTGDAEIRAILDLSRANGIRVLDTASSYGVSEQALGQALLPKDDFRIVTKSALFRASSVTASHAAQMLDQFSKSLVKLCRPNVDTLLFHSTSDLFMPGGELFVEAVLELQAQGKIKNWGASIYAAQEIDDLLSRYSPQVLQVPLNIFDQRLLQSGHLQRLVDANIEIHARSVFLQGFLLMDPSRLPPYFTEYRDLLSRFQQECRRNNTTPLAAALYFVRTLPEPDVVLVGVNSSAQLREMLAPLHGLPAEVSRSLATDAIPLLDPSKWRLNASGR